MSKFNFKNPKILALISILTSGIILTIVLPYILKAENEQINIIVATKNLSQGDVFTNDNITIKRVTKKDVDMKNYVKKEEVINTYATIDILSGDIITKNKKSEIRGIDYGLEENEQAVGLNVSSLSNVVGYKIVRGDVVDLYITTDNEMYTCIEDVEVLDLVKEDGQSVNGRNKSKDGGVSFNCMIVKVDSDITEYLVRANNGGLIQVVKKYNENVVERNEEITKNIEKSGLDESDTEDDDEESESGK